MIKITPKIKNNFKKVNSLIKSSKKILIVSHKSPDQDAVGSALALKLALQEKGVDASIFISGYSKKEFSFLPGYQLIKPILTSHDFDLVFGLDYGHINRLDIDELLNKSNPSFVTIDHHIDSGLNHIGSIKIVCSASSTSEIIYYYLKYSKFPINKDIATCILSGIIGDTEGFIHSNTSHKTLSISGELLSMGVKINKITKQVLNNKYLVDNPRSLGKILSGVKKYSDLSLVYLVIKNSDFESWNKTCLENLVSTINTAEDCKWALLLVEYDQNKTKASLRSEEHAQVDVSKIANLFGGGGHKLASGFRVDKAPEEVLNLLIRRVKNNNLLRK